jgi:ammonium transporter, Amt family
VLWITSRFTTLRVREFEERAGLDVSLHNEQLGH